MRLIDADEAKKFYKENLILPEKSHEIIVRTMIDAVPTAYSVDKVVEELESFAKLAEDRWTNGTSKYACQEHKCWVKAIEIVKQGGVSDDVCQWKVFDNSLTDEITCGKYVGEEHTSKAFVYCSY